ncbi:glycosyltransferase [Caldisericum exile]|uniref:Glycosyltransferase n=1 Tax=Caldisericum exile (strain DSM 21853 / NBRC 104410 / AZM16c01) TaxID=511051 RepID=A0A7U6GFW9_CALEA|nr:glycosyltransferase [Caldisericum exile]BAL81629.1 putative glycosyltransferase [Caldisericum exile AZM16c01]
MILPRLVIAVSILFWILILYYAVLSVAGLIYRTRRKKEVSLESYQDVDILIPARNEGKVLFETLDAMAKLDYPGKYTVYVLNDSSEDNTKEIAEFFEKKYKNFKHIEVPEGSPKGKSRVLNYGLTISKSKIIAVYDADNEPDKFALRRLIEQMSNNPKNAGAVGYVKTKNIYKNSLTRMIGLEFMLFQLVMQCGRWQLFKFGTLTGTNFVIKRQVIEELSGWDNYALAEDAELTARIYAKGYLIPVVDDSITYEQEPESFKVFFKQRTRWLIGNLYLISKIFNEPELRKGKNFINNIQLVSVYYVFVFFVIASDIWFVLGLLNRLSIPYTIPLLLLWFETLWIYTSEIIASEVIDNEINFKNTIFAFLMYFTYAQLWIILAIRSYFLKFKQREKQIVWDKTPRF